VSKTALGAGVRPVDGRAKGVHPAGRRAKVQYERKYSNLINRQLDLYNKEQDPYNRQSDPYNKQRDLYNKQDPYIYKLPDSIK